MGNNFDLKKFLVENKLTSNSRSVNEALTVPGNSEEEEKKNAEELLALAKKVGLDKAEIKYREDGSIFGVELNDTVEDRNAGKTRKVSDLQDKQYQAAKAALDVILENFSINFVSIVIKSFHQSIYFDLFLTQTLSNAYKH